MTYSVRAPVEVRSSDVVRVWRIDIDTFRSIAATHSLIDHAAAEADMSLARGGLVAPDSAEWARLAATGITVKRRVFRKGQHLVSKDDRGSSCFYILRGAVECTSVGSGTFYGQPCYCLSRANRSHVSLLQSSLCLTVRAGSRAMFQVTIRAGNFVGERSFLRGDRRGANVIAADDHVEVFELDRPKVRFCKLHWLCFALCSHASSCRVLRFRAVCNARSIS